MRQTERGNILWFVMVAVIFTALLTMVLTRSSSTVEQAGDREQITIKITQVLRYAKSIESAIQDLSIRGVSINDVSFENAVTDVDYTNPKCQDNLCKLFDPAGAGLRYQRPPDGVAPDGAEWLFTADNNVGSEDDPVGTFGAPRGNELLMILERANPRFCQQLNRQFGITETPEIPRDGGINLEPYIGTFSNELSVLEGDPDPFEFENQRFGCFRNGLGSEKETFYYVLLAQ
ncbi:MAG: hypothetical protein AAF182_00080 [Pseudomonadota bacterium]